MDELNREEIIKALECCVCIGENENCYECKYNQEYLHGSSLLMDALALIKEIMKEKNYLEYTLAGVMHSVDKWLDGEELEKDEVSRAITMREKTLQIVEKLTKEKERLELESLAKTERSESRKEADIIEILELRLKVEEIFEEIEEMLNLQAKIVCETRDKYSETDKPLLSFIAMQDGRIYSLRVVEEHIAELKKKHTEGEK